MFLTGTAAASGIAWINSLGNLGGFFGPSMVGWAKTLTGSFAGGLYALAVCALASAVISLFWLRIPRAIATGEELAAARIRSVGEPAVLSGLVQREAVRLEPVANPTPSGVIA